MGFIGSIQNNSSRKFDSFVLSECWFDLFLMVFHVIMILILTSICMLIYFRMKKYSLVGTPLVFWSCRNYLRQYFVENLLFFIHICILLNSFLHFYLWLIFLLPSFLCFLLNLLHIATKLWKMPFKFSSKVISIRRNSIIY